MKSKQQQLECLDLFSGIGGFSLGLERTQGFKTKAFCEIDPFCRKVLAKHWPDVPIHHDIRELTGEQVGPVDVICGGFPCQDISYAGKGAGLAGERSGLWKEFARLISEIRPGYVIVENTAALLGRGLPTVLGDLAEIGYDAEWHCIPASAVGAPHRRDRIWIIAYPNQGLCQSRHVINQINVEIMESEWQTSEINSLICCKRDDIKTDRHSLRNDDGFSRQLDRIGALGNSVVPQIPEAIGRAILASMATGVIA